MNPGDDCDCVGCRSRFLVEMRLSQVVPMLWMGGMKENHSHIGVSKNSGIPKWINFIMENPIKMDDLGVPLFLETSISGTS